MQANEVEQTQTQTISQAATVSESPSRRNATILRVLLYIESLGPSDWNRAAKGARNSRGSSHFCSTCHDLLLNQKAQRASEGICFHGDI